MMIENLYDHVTRTYVIKYQVGRQQVVTRMPHDANQDELMEWREYHYSIVRDMVLKKLTADDTECARPA